jgi:hypothetical protein
MNQTTVLDWLGIDVWRLREPRPVPSVPQSLRSESLEPSVVLPPETVRLDTTNDRVDSQPLPEPVPGSAAAILSESVSPARLVDRASISSTLTICVPSGTATYPLFARIAQTVPRSVTVVTESTEVAGSILIRWQGRDWLLHDLRQDPGLKRRLWRALCIPASSAE